MRPHALLGAATGLVAQFRCGLWGCLVNVHSRQARCALVSLASIAEWPVNNRCVSAPHDDMRRDVGGRVTDGADSPVAVGWSDRARAMAL